jgi:hypothetical protein
LDCARLNDVLDPMPSGRLRRENAAPC